MIELGEEVGLCVDRGSGNSSSQTVADSGDMNHNVDTSLLEILSVYHDSPSISDPKKPMIVTPIIALVKKDM